VETRVSLPIPGGPVYLAAEDAHVRFIDRDVFLVSFAPDCVGHSCRCRDEGDRLRLDACCQHGADVRVPEKTAILRRAAEIASVLKPGRRDPGSWFDEREQSPDPEAPLGFVIRTATTDLDDESSGCVFLEHTGARGCGLHLAAERHALDPASLKPLACRLYPLSFEYGRLGLSDDFYRYSCASSGSTSVYQVMRETIAATFGQDSVRALDRLDDRTRSRALRILPPDGG
jgi:Fe-S-cluster containining protein